MPPSSPLDRRREERMKDELPVTVRVINLAGERIKITTTLANISSGGLFLYLPFQIRLESQLFALISLPNAVGLVAIGHVVRTEMVCSRSTGVAICFKRTRLLELSV